MNAKTCEGRKLGPKDCWLRKDCENEDRVGEKSSIAHTLVISKGSTQGYLINGDIQIPKQNETFELQRFGLPKNTDNGCYAAILVPIKPKIVVIDNCCDFNAVAMINPYKKVSTINPYNFLPTFNNEYISRLHKTQNWKEMAKDLEGVLEIQSLYQYEESFLEWSYIKKLEPYDFKCFLGIKTRNRGATMGITIWETPLSNGKKKTRMVVEEYADSYGIMNPNENFIRDVFEKCQETISGFYYPKKVLDVLGE
jgi:hypothetical protein